jgi:hypothetical protein
VRRGETGVFARICWREARSGSLSGWVGCPSGARRGIAHGGNEARSSSDTRDLRAAVPVAITVAAAPAFRLGHCDQLRSGSTSHGQRTRRPGPRFPLMCAPRRGRCLRRGATKRLIARSQSMVSQHEPPRPSQAPRHAKRFRLSRGRGHRETEQASIQHGAVHANRKRVKHRDDPSPARPDLVEIHVAQGPRKQNDDANPGSHPPGKPSTTRQLLHLVGAETMTPPRGAHQGVGGLLAWASSTTGVMRSLDKYRFAVPRSLGWRLWPRC